MTECLVTSPTAAVYLGSLSNNVFANVSVLGDGNILGVPLRVSKAAGAKLILLDAAVLGVSDNGAVIESSNYAALQMDSAPAAGASNLVSAFQTNTTFIRITPITSKANHGTTVGGRTAIGQSQIATTSGGSHGHSILDQNSFSVIAP